MPLNLNDLVYQRKGVNMSLLAPGALLVNMNSGRCFELNRVGADVWAILQKPIACEDVYAQIATRYRIATGQAVNEVGKLLQELLREELIDCGPPSP